jgi:cell wall assembly regulator SMI1
MLADESERLHTVGQWIEKGENDYTVTRYPGDYEPITLAEARKAVTLARRVRRELRRHLPGQALQD